MEGNPEIRASWSRLVLSALKRTTGGDLIRAQLRERRARLREVGLAGWAAVESHLDVLEAIESSWGRRRAQDFHRDLMVDAMQRPLLRPMRAAARRIYGKTPDSYARVAPQVHRLVARGCGTVEIEPTGERSVDFVLRELPHVLRRRTAFLVSYEAMCEAILADLGIPGQVVRNDDRLVRGESRIEMSW